MKYEVIHAITIKILTEEVEIYLKNGWKCIGGIAVHPQQMDFYQAMIKD